MIKVENIDIWGFEHAIRGMRNPLNSWDKSDSEAAFHMVENFSSDDPMAEKYRKWNDIYGLNIKIGPNDLSLMRRLYKAGSEHRKYLRQIMISMDITAPLYWWKEFDTYKVGTVANSCSTMHKIAAKEFELDDFSFENVEGRDEECVISLFLNVLNANRKKYLETKDKRYWWNMIQLLPSSYNQKRTVTMNYENVITMIRQRTGHKLDEWNEFVDILSNLPYVEEITAYETIDAETLKGVLMSESYDKHQYCFPCKELLNAIDQAPTIDQVIKCKDCGYFTPFKKLNDDRCSRGICHADQMPYINVRADHFCGFAKVKEKANDQV